VNRHLTAAAFLALLAVCAFARNDQEFTLEEPAK